MKKLLVVNHEAMEAQNADELRVGKVGWLAAYIEDDGVGYHGYYLIDGKLVERRDLLSELMRESKDRNIMREDYHPASQEEFAAFQAMEKVSATS